MLQIVPFDRLPTADLVVDAVYEGLHEAKDAGGDPLAKLLPGVGNSGGFRMAGRGLDKRLVALYSSGADRDWPDVLDPATGRFVYYGDNKTPGRELHDTPKKGNEVLRRVFERLHAPPDPSRPIPPVFVFVKAATPKSSRSVQFKGVAVPGYPTLPATEDLVAIWKTTDGQRFQNYRATFTVLDVGVVPRVWLNDVLAGETSSPHAPAAWQQWQQTRRYRALTAPPTTHVRSVAEQTPATPEARAMLEAIYRHFEPRPVAFEAFAAKIFEMHEPERVVVDTITRASVDGGRDAIGRYRLGLDVDPVHTEFALEAKCYRPGVGSQPPSPVGVKEVARLVSRLRHRDFGVLVTTSVIGKQAYEEVRGDGHPIVFVTGRDIVDILVRNGIDTVVRVRDLLTREYPIAGSVPDP